MKNNMIVIVEVEGTDYMVGVNCESLLQAEHRFLDAGIGYMSEYTVQASMAFDVEGMNSDTFRAMALDADTVSEKELMEIIAEANKRLEAKKAAEEEIEKQKKIREELRKQIEELQSKVDETFKAEQAAKNIFWGSKKAA